MSFDLNTNIFIHTLSNPFLNGFFTAVTLFGTYGLPALAVAFLFFKKTRFLGFTLIVSLILDLILCSGMKLLISRPRPYEKYPVDLLIGEPAGSSFPSSHSSVAICFATVYFKLAKERPETIYRWILLVVALLICYSRLYLFVHYPSDVLAGIIFGFLIGSYGVYLCRRLREKGYLKFLKLD